MNEGIIIAISGQRSKFNVNDIFFLNISFLSIRFNFNEEEEEEEKRFDFQMMMMNTLTVFFYFATFDLIFALSHWFKMMKMIHGENFFCCCIQKQQQQKKNLIIRNYDLFGLNDFQFLGPYFFRFIYSPSALWWFFFLVRQQGQISIYLFF